MFIYRKTACKSFDAKFVLDLDLGPELGDSALPEVVKKARALPRELTRRPHVEGAYQKDNGKWANYHMFPGREFDDLDELRAAKRQHAEQRAACVPARISRAFRVSGEKE